MEHKKIARETGENSIRIEQIIHLASMCNCDQMPDAVEDVFNQDWEEVWEILKIEPIDNDMDIDIDIETISAHLYENNKQGFLIQAATPCPYDFSTDGNSYSTSGWRMYTMEWFYVEEFSDVFPLIEKWKEKYIQVQRKKFTNAKI